MVYTIRWNRGGYFLVLSAYGLNESWIHFGYKHWWSKRILSVVVPYAIAQLCIYWPFHNFLFKECILDILCIEVKYIYGWYLPYLLFWYIIFYIVKRIKFLEKNEMIIFCIISILLLLSTKGVQGEQSFSFAFGVFLSRNKNSKKLETKINIKTAFVLLSVGIGFLIIKQIPFIRTVPYMIYNMVEMAIKLPCALGLMMVIFFSSNVLNSKYLSWIGSISYEIYLLHGYILNRTSISLTGSVLFISVTFLSSIIYWFFIEQIIGRLKQIIEI